MRPMRQRMEIQTRANLLDRAIGWLSPGWQVKRMRGRVALEAFAKYYEAGEVSRRTQGWKRPSGDPNAPTGISLGRLRDAARHLVRNNGHAQSGLQTITDDVVGWGIMPTVQDELWAAWAGSTDIDADGRCDLSGLEHLVMRTIAESGECLVRRRFRRLRDRLPIPLQIEVLEPDFIDSSKHSSLHDGGRIVRGVEFDAIGRRAAYWLFREHPGSTTTLGSVRFSGSRRVPASEILHIYRTERPKQVRGASWFAPVLIRFNDYDEFADATLMKQKIAACLAVLTTDVDGSAGPLGTTTTENPDYDFLEPGIIKTMLPGQSIEVVNPPSVSEYSDFVGATLREIASGLGVTPEDLHGDYSKMNFSSARLSRLRHWARVEGWRWRMLVPQFLNPIWAWHVQARSLAGVPAPAATTGWTAPPLPMIEPDMEGLAILRNIRSGIMTPSEALRERGWVPEEFWNEYQRDFDDLERRGLVTDADARKMSQAGTPHPTTPTNSRDPVLETRRTRPNGKPPTTRAN